MGFKGIASYVFFSTVLYDQCAIFYACWVTLEREGEKGGLGRALGGTHKAGLSAAKRDVCALSRKSPACCPAVLLCTESQE